MSALLDARLLSLTILVSLSSNCALCRLVEYYGLTSTEFKLASYSVCNPCGDAVPIYGSSLWNVRWQNWHTCNLWLNVLYLPWFTWILLQCVQCNILYTNFFSCSAGAACSLQGIGATLAPLVWGAWLAITVAGTCCG